VHGAFGLCSLYVRQVPSHLLPRAIRQRKHTCLSDDQCRNTCFVPAGAGTPGYGYTPGTAYGSGYTPGVGGTPGVGNGSTPGFYPHAAPTPTAGDSGLYSAGLGEYGAGELVPP
jgi:hypothetical protein